MNAQQIAAHTGRMPSLYANLLEDEAPSGATISAAPVKYEFKQPPQEEEKKPDAALRFQPVKRPTATQKPRPRPSAPSRLPAGEANTPAGSNLEQWKATEEDLDYAEHYKSQRHRGRKKKKDKKKLKFGEFYADDDEYEEVDFDAIYDPAVHTNLKAYRHSDEYYDAVRDWKDKLHAHENRGSRKRRRSRQPEEEVVRAPKQAFAPPPSYMEDAPPPPPPQDTGEDAHIARMRMQEPPPASLPPYATSQDHTLTNSNIAAPTEPPAAQAYSATLSSAPVSYAAPSSDQAFAPDDFSHAPQDQSNEAPDEDAPRSNRPGQKGFAARLLSKYGWTPGTGLGASNSGITTILQHQPLKRKKRPDSEGGGWATPASMGRIVGGKRARADTEGETWTNIVRFTGLLRGVDDVETQLAQDGLMQALGEAMEEFGVVERVRFRHALEGSEVFVKFTSALSAFNAIRAVKEGRDLMGLSAGGGVEGTYWAEERFEAGDLEDEAKE